MNPVIPIKNPRSAALVGLTMDASDEEFRRKWQEKFPDQGVRTNEPTSFGSRGTTAKAEPEITGDAKKKAENRRLFLDEVAKFQEAGHTYQEAWVLAGNTEPGKTYYAVWASGADEKFASVAINDADVRQRQARFKSLMQERERQLPNECHQERFKAVANSDQGAQVVAQMKRAESEQNFASQFSDQSSIPAATGAYRNSEEAKAVFLAEFETLHNKGLDYTDAWNTAASVSPGREAYVAWKTLSEKAKNLPPISRRPAFTRIPASAQRKYA